MIDAMISAPIHILVSMRVKTEWVVEKDDRTGKSTPRKVGLQPVMRDGIEYEFDVCGDMDQENTLVITKSRCPKLSGGVFQKPGGEVAEVLKTWLVSGEAQPAPPEIAKPDPPLAAVTTSVEPPKVASESVLKAPTPQRKVAGELETIWKRMCSARGVAQELAAEGRGGGVGGRNRWGGVCPHPSPAWSRSGQRLQIRAGGAAVRQGSFSADRGTAVECDREPG